MTAFVPDERDDPELQEAMRHQHEVAEYEKAWHDLLENTPEEEHDILLRQMTEWNGAVQEEKNRLHNQWLWNVLEERLELPVTQFPPL